MNMANEKRGNARIDFHLPVTIKGHQGLNKVKDFSMGGLFIEMEDAPQFKQGDEIDLIMKLPHENNTMQVRALVTHVTGKGIGVEFVDLSPQHAMALENCFHIFKDTIPLADS